MASIVIILCGDYYCYRVDIIPSGDVKIVRRQTVNNLERLRPSLLFLLL